MVDFCDEMLHSFLHYLCASVRHIPTHTFTHSSFPLTINVKQGRRNDLHKRKIKLTLPWDVAAIRLLERLICPLDVFIFMNSCHSETLCGEMAFQGIKELQREWQKRQILHALKWRNCLQLSPFVLWTGCGTKVYWSKKLNFWFEII